MAVRTDQLTLARLGVEESIGSRVHDRDIPCLAVEVVPVKHNRIFQCDLQLTIRTLTSFQFGLEQTLPTWHDIALDEVRTAIGRRLGGVELCGIRGLAGFTGPHCIQQELFFRQRNFR